MRTVLTDLEDAAKFIKDGDTVAIGGTFLENVPMALIREVIRRRVEELNLIVAAHGIGVDVLIGAGCVRSLTGAYIGFEDYGLAPNFRRAVENGELEFRESSCYAIISGIKAAALGLPFLPMRGLIGSDVMKVMKEYQVFRWKDEDVVLIPAFKIDVALIHAQRADPEGNIQIEGSTWDDMIAEAAKRVIVTVEEIVDNEKIRRSPEKTKISGFLVSALAHAPFGAHPAGCSYVYDYDEEHIRLYLETASSEKGFMQYLKRYVYGCRTNQEYLESIGHEKLSQLSSLKRS